LCYSLIVAAFFSVLLRRGLRDQCRLGAYILLGMVGGTLTLAYLMFPFPR
jgi:hypothetical protein